MSILTGSKNFFTKTRRYIDSKFEDAKKYTDKAKADLSVIVSQNYAKKVDVYTKQETDEKLELKADTSSLATVATTGNYKDLINVPTFAADSGQVSMVELFNGDSDLSDSEYKLSLSDNQKLLNISLQLLHITKSSEKIISSIQLSSYAFDVTEQYKRESSLQFIDSNNTAQYLKVETYKGTEEGKKCFYIKFPATNQARADSGDIYRVSNVTGYVLNTNNEPS